MTSNAIESDRDVPHHSGMTLDDRALMLRSIAEHWDSAIHLYDQGRTPVLYEYQLLDFLYAGVERYAHPSLDREQISQHMRDLLKAVNDLARWECDGLLPDTMDDDIYSARDADAVMQTINSDIDGALAPLLYGVDCSRLCFRCQRYNAEVTTWRPQAPGHHLCWLHLAENTAGR